MPVGDVEALEGVVRIGVDGAAGLHRGTHLRLEQREAQPQMTAGLLRLSVQHPGLFRGALPRDLILVGELHHVVAPVPLPGLVVKALSGSSARPRRSPSRGTCAFFGRLGGGGPAAQRAASLS